MVYTPKAGSLAAKIRAQNDALKVKNQSIATPPVNQPTSNVNFGDVSGASTAQQNTNQGTVQTVTNTAPNSDLFQFGDIARQREQSSP